MYQKGRGLPQDHAQAAAWYRKAAEQGLGQAQNNLGLLYKNGRGVPQDYVQAIAWLILAKAGGNPDAAFNLVEIERHAMSSEIARGQALADQWRAQHPSGR
jgi:hypothetical protein